MLLHEKYLPCIRKDPLENPIVKYLLKDREDLEWDI